MTREECIEILKNKVGYSDCDGNCENCYLCNINAVENALKMAIETLEQEPCENAVSRQAVIEAIVSIDASNGTEPVFTGNRIQAILKDLPSVYSKKTTGKWADKYHEPFKYYCNKCGTGSDLRTNYCPNCGAKMEVEE